MNNEKLQIDFGEGLKNPEAAKLVVKQIQNTIDELIVARDEALKLADQTNELLEISTKDNGHLNTAIVNMSDVIKNIHMVLNTNAELVDQSEDIAKLRTRLSQFVLNSGMIKLGVKSNAK